jgi:hypothetical protein
MEEHHVPYRYHTYTDSLIAVGTARLIEALFVMPGTEIEIHAKPDGFRIRYPARTEVRPNNPFREVKDKASREVVSPQTAWDRTPFRPTDPKPDWWGTTSVINSLGSPVFNNKIAQAYTPELGAQLLEGTADFTTGSMSQLLYAQASKGVNRPGLSTSQGNLSAPPEQVLALLGYQTGGAGYMRDPYTISVVPRPREITLQGYISLANFLRGYVPKATSGKPLPTREQTVPFFIAMTYFDFLIELFAYRQEAERAGGYFDVGIGKYISSLDRVMYYSMGTSSAPFLMDSLTIPEWLDRRSVAVNVRDMLRDTLGAHLDPNLLYLPVRAFAEKNPQLLVRFYRHYEPLARGFERKKKGQGVRLLEQSTLEYIMKRTGYEDLNSDAMHHFARAIRSRTLTRLYSRESNEPPDFELLTRLKSAALSDPSLVNMLSQFVGSYNLRNARLSAVGKHPDGPNLSYTDLQEIIGLIEKYGAEFVANTLMAQAMSKRPGETESPASEAETVETA